MTIKELCHTMTGHACERIHNEYLVFKWNRQQKRARKTIDAIIKNGRVID